jgi:hypothetical protein
LAPVGHRRAAVAEAEKLLFVSFAIF